MLDVNCSKTKTVLLKSGGSIDNVLEDRGNVIERGATDITSEGIQCKKRCLLSLISIKEEIRC